MQNQESRFTRRKFLKAFVQTTTVLTVGTVGNSLYVTQIEPNTLDITRLDLPLRHLPTVFDGFTLAQISDLHFGEWMTLGRMQTIVDKVNDLGADAVVITGDFASMLPPGTLDDVTTALRGLSAPQGIYGILGNHDHWTDAALVSGAIRAAGVQLLINEHIAFERDGEQLFLAGVDDIWEEKNDLNAALEEIPADSCVVLLAHEPDFADEAAATGRVALQLSGHSHGGQVRLPFRGALILPYLGRKYDMGQYEVDDMTLYVYRGVGMIAPYVRMGCEPEITLITLQTVETT